MTNLVYEFVSIDAMLLQSRELHCVEGDVAEVTYANGEKEIYMYKDKHWRPQFPDDSYDKHERTFYKHGEVETVVGYYDRKNVKLLKRWYMLSDSLMMEISYDDLVYVEAEYKQRKGIGKWLEFLGLLKNKMIKASTYRRVPKTVFVKSSSLYIEDRYPTVECSS